ncbi:MAG TPA: Lsr2 family protein [Pseudonocardiaceae bacterium]|nr:Lsr2 family protein [Pseudonocardiaceae bacterium]
MVQRVVTEFIDDIDGSPAERTFAFAVDGTNYEIDLSAQNIAEFKSAIGGFIESARKVQGSRSNDGRRTRGARASGRQSREQTQAVRQWARQHGHNVGNRGRIPASIRQAFDQAHTAA